MSDLERSKHAAITLARNSMPKQALAVGANFTVGLKKDYTVIATGSNDDGQCDVDDWRDVIAIDAGTYHTLALKSDGTVVATGLNEQGQCDVSEWVDVVQISAGAYDSYGLRSDGTVYATGFHNNYFVEELNRIKLIAAGSYGVVFVSESNEIITPFKSLQKEVVMDIIDISISTGYTISLSNSGDIKTDLQLDEKWYDVTAISAGTVGTLAIKSDNTLYAHFFKQRDAFDHENITDVIAVSAGGGHHAIMLIGGKVMAFGANSFGQCNVEDWDLIDWLIESSLVPNT